MTLLDLGHQFFLPGHALSDHLLHWPVQPAQGLHRDLILVDDTVFVQSVEEDWLHVSLGISNFRLNDLSEKTQQSFETKEAFVTFIGITL